MSKGKKASECSILSRARHHVIYHINGRVFVVTPVHRKDGNTMSELLLRLMKKDAESIENT
jgi:hypothetical protein